MKTQIQLTKRLKSLYSQKKLIEEEIDSLEKQLSEKSSFSKDEKIELFKTLFISRNDIYLKKWVSSDNKRSGFSPVTRTFKGTDYIPLGNNDIEQHLRGNIQIATYSISKENKSKFLVLQILPTDKVKLLNALLSLELDAYFELNSTLDMFAWIFFEEELLSKDVKTLAQKLIKNANISAKIYPNQDFVNSSNLGSFIELPLHLRYRNENKTVFLTSEGEVEKDQWKLLHQVKKVSTEKVQRLIRSENELQFFDENVLQNIEFPNFKLNLILYDFVYIPTLELSTSLLVHLKAFASFDNPQIKTLQALRKPLYNIPRVICNYEEDERYLKLPRGLISEVEMFFRKNNVSYDISNKTFFKKEVFKEVVFDLRPEQNDAIKEISKRNFSICVAPPGFGKTLIGAKMIEIRSCNTLVVVNKNMLLDQWIDRFKNYFDMSKKEVGFLGKSKNTLNGKLDIATMQSLKNSPEIIENYSFVIVDECHHIPAVTFEQIIKLFHGKYILGLSATPNRKDGLQPILFQQLGRVAYEYRKKRTITHKLKIVKTNFMSNEDTYAQIVNDLCNDEERNNLILQEIKALKNRKSLVLTDRIEHINNLAKLLDNEGISYISIHGSLTKKEQNENMLKVNDSNLVLATTSFFGEGIDFPHLNSIIFATPISYYGRLVQYLGRVGRDGQVCLAIDLLDTKNAMLYSAYKKRLDGYKQMHYSAK